MSQVDIFLGQTAGTGKDECATIEAPKSEQAQIEGKTTFRGAMTKKFCDMTKLVNSRART